MPRHPGPELKILPGLLKHFSDRTMHILGARIGKYPEIAMRLSALMSPFGATEKNKKIWREMQSRGLGTGRGAGTFRGPNILVALEPKEPRSSTVKSKG